MLCKLQNDEIIEKSCLNPFSTKEGLRGRFIGLPNTEKTKSYLVKKGYKKTALAVVGGGTILLVSLSAAGTELLLADMITAHGSSASLAHQSLMAAGALTLFGVGSSSAVLSLLTGKNEHETAKVVGEAFSVDPKSVAITKNVKNILSPIASALDLVVFDEQVARVEAYK